MRAAPLRRRAAAKRGTLEPAHRHKAPSRTRYLPWSRLPCSTPPASPPASPFVPPRPPPRPRHHPTSTRSERAPRISVTTQTPHTRIHMGSSAPWRAYTPVEVVASAGYHSRLWRHPLIPNHCPRLRHPTRRNRAPRWVDKKRSVCALLVPAPKAGSPHDHMPRPVDHVHQSSL